MVGDAPLSRRCRPPTDSAAKRCKLGKPPDRETASGRAGRVLTLVRTHIVTPERNPQQTMSSSESLTQKWLRQNIATYNDGNRVFIDVDSTLTLYPTLRPKTDVYSSVTCPERSFLRRPSSHHPFHLPHIQPMTTVALNSFSVFTVSYP